MFREKKRIVHFNQAIVTVLGRGPSVLSLLLLRAQRVFSVLL